MTYNKDTFWNIVAICCAILIFVILPFINSDIYNKWRAEYYIKNNNIDKASIYLKNLAFDSSDSDTRIESANLLLNLYLSNNYEYEAYKFAKKVNSNNYFANYVIGMYELKENNIAHALYYFYKAKPVYPDGYNNLVSQLKENGETFLSDLLIPNDWTDFIPQKKIFKYSKMLLKIGKSSKMGKKLYYGYNIQYSLRRSKYKINKFKKCLENKSYNKCIKKY